MSFLDRIKAVFILQRFVRMSRILIPIYTNLMAKTKRTEDEERKLKKIDGVYSNFKANPETSILLINSNILKLIQKIIQNSKESRIDEDSELFQAFIKESDKLIQTWNFQTLN